MAEQQLSLFGPDLSRPILSVLRNPATELASARKNSLPESTGAWLAINPPTSRQPYGGKP